MPCRAAASGASLVRVALDGAVWRARYGRVDPTEKERLLKLGEERRRQQAMAKQIFAERAAPKT